MLFFRDFNSTNATVDSSYQVNLTISDSVGAKREISFNFTIATNAKTNSSAS